MRIRKAKPCSEACKLLGMIPDCSVDIEKCMNNLVDCKCKNKTPSPIVTGEGVKTRITNGFKILAN